MDMRYIGNDLSFLNFVFSELLSFPSPSIKVILSLGLMDVSLSRSGSLDSKATLSLSLARPGEDVVRPDDPLWASAS